MREPKSDIESKVKPASLEENSRQRFEDECLQRLLMYVRDEPPFSIYMLRYTLFRPLLAATCNAVSPFRLVSLRSIPVRMVKGEDGA